MIRLSSLLLLFLATLAGAQTAPATPILADFGIPLSGTPPPTCTMAERNARTGNCTGLANPFTSSTCAVVTDPSSTSCTTAGVSGNPDVLCCYDDVLDVWYNPAANGGGAHTHAVADVDYLFRQSPGEIYLDKDNDGTAESNGICTGVGTPIACCTDVGEGTCDEDQVLTQLQYDVILDFNDTVRYPTNLAKIKALNSALDPWLRATSRDLTRTIKIAGQIDLGPTDCALYASNSERDCLLLAPTTGLDANGQPNVDCTRSVSSGTLTIVIEPGFQFNFYADGGDGVGGGNDQTVLTRGIQFGAGNICGFESATQTAGLLAGRIDAPVYIVGAPIVLNQPGAAVHTGWTQYRVPVPYYAGKSSNTTYIAIANADSNINQWNSGIYVNGGGDYDNINVESLWGYRWRLGHVESSAAGTGLLAHGQGGPAELAPGSHITSSVGWAVAFGNESGTHTIVNPNCLREAAPISLAGTCDGARPVGLNSGHSFKLNGAIIEATSGALMLATGLTGWNYAPTYFEAGTSGTATQWAYEGNVILGAGFRSDTGVPCTVDPAGAPTCDAPEDAFEGGSTILEDYVEGVTFDGAYAAHFGIGPGADNGSVGSTFLPEAGLTLRGTDVTNSAKLLCTANNTPNDCCSGSGTEDSTNACNNLFVANSAANVTLDFSDLSDGNDGFGWLTTGGAPTSYAGRIVTKHSQTLAVGPAGSHTYGNDERGQTFSTSSVWTSTGNGSMLVTRNTTTTPDEILVNLNTKMLGGDGQGLGTLWGDETLDPDADLVGAGEWRFATTGSDPKFQWLASGLPDNWFKLSTLNGVDWGNAILSFTSDTSETCDAGEHWFGRTAGAGGGDGKNLVVCDDGAVFVLPGSGGGSSIVGDLGDDGANESSGILEIATTGDHGTNPVFSFPSANKLLATLTRPWPGGATKIDGDNNLTAEWVLVTTATLHCTASDVPCMCNTDNSTSTIRGCINKYGEFIPQDNAATNGNIAKMLANNTALATDPTCANKFTTNQYGWLDEDEGSDLDVAMCYEGARAFGVAEGGFMVIGDVQTGNATADGNGDVYIEQELEVDGPARFDSTVEANAAVTVNSTLQSQKKLFTLATLSDTTSPHDLLALEVGDTFITNDGASGAAVLNLPAAVAGMCVHVILMSAQDVDINPNGTNRLLTDLDSKTNLTDANGDAISSDAGIGSNIRLCAMNSTTWVATQKSGTWTDVN